MPDLYSTLGVEATASAKDISKAYKLKALKNHPDRGGSKEAFQAIGEAYQVLSDERKRAE
jgi:curved DNA-binding protein CbpA